VRLLVHVEGETEEAFVREILAPHLQGVGYEKVGARLLGNARARARRGGIRSWDIVKGDLIRHLAGDTGCIATLMVDYYALPSTAPNAWPGRALAAALPLIHRGRSVEQALHADIDASCAFAARFEPYVLMHEFEALLFSNCTAFAGSIGHATKAAAFSAIRNEFATPEEINDSPITAPSKRIAGLIPEYRKPLYGIIAAIDIGLEAMRLECPNFDNWLTRLEARAV